MLLFHAIVVGGAHAANRLNKGAGLYLEDCYLVFHTLLYTQPACQCKSTIISGIEPIRILTVSEFLTLNTQIKAKCISFKGLGVYNFPTLNQDFLQCSFVPSLSPGCRDRPLPPALGFRFIWTPWRIRLFMYILLLWGRFKYERIQRVRKGWIQGYGSTH